MRSKLFGITTTYNCEKLVPFVMKYQELLGYDKFIVFDNESTDRTVELLLQYPFVEVRQYNSNGIFSDDIKAQILCKGCEEILQQQERAEDLYTWINCCDFDEVLFYPYHGTQSDAFKVFLSNISFELKYNVIAEDIIDIFNKNFSEKELNPDILAHKQLEFCSYGVPLFWNKPSFFRADTCRQFILYPGHHVMRYDFGNEEVKALQNCRDIFRFHLKYIFGENYVKKQFKDYGRGNGYRTNFVDKFNSRTKAETESYFEDISFPLGDYIKNKRLNGKNVLDLNENNTFLKII